MAFIFVCGTHTFTNALKDYEQVTVQCQNCGNFSAKCYTRWEWFTFCFIPLIPFSLRPYKEVGCRICNNWQEMKYRPDVESGRTGQIPMQPGGGGIPPGGPPGGPNTGPQYG